MTLVLLSSAMCRISKLFKGCGQEEGEHWSEDRMAWQGTNDGNGGEYRAIR